MTSSVVKVAQLSIESLAVEFLKQSEGTWHCQRRYYTLDREVEPVEVTSSIKIRFIEEGAAELVELARLHGLEEEKGLKAGSEVIWESNYTKPIRKPSKGSTVFGVLGDKLYRDRGFATTEPVTASLLFPSSKTMCLKTEYGGSVFEEEIKLIGQNYRTRQTIISRAGEERTIGQYLEKRIK